VLSDLDLENSDWYLQNMWPRRGAKVIDVHPWIFYSFDPERWLAAEGAANEVEIKISALRPPV
jgi:hypothetical protein